MGWPGKVSLKGVFELNFEGREEFYASEMKRKGNLGMKGSQFKFPEMEHRVWYRRNREKANLAGL